MSAIDDLPPLREVIREHSLSARKSLGQNFLLDLNLTARIARAAGPLDGTTVIEVGPGPGGLTRALLALGAKRVIAVAALNPHAGEGGLFGREDIEVSEPTIARAVRDGLRVFGPVPGDTVFVKLRAGQYDAVVAMYHDQGHGPVKVMGLEEGVNITVGLPVVRTSVDHGTAFDIAGKGIASERSLIEAIEYAERLSAARGAAA